jgi:hypothetical protein
VRFLVKKERGETIVPSDGTLKGSKQDWVGQLPITVTSNHWLHTFVFGMIYQGGKRGVPKGRVSGKVSLYDADNRVGKVQHFVIPACKT